MKFEPWKVSHKRNHKHWEVSVVVSIPAFQAGVMGSNPVLLNFYFCSLIFLSLYLDRYYMGVYLA